MCGFMNEKGRQLRSKEDMCQTCGLTSEEIQKMKCSMDQRLILVISKRRSYIFYEYYFEPCVLVDFYLFYVTYCMHP